MRKTKFGNLNALLFGTIIFLLFSNNAMSQNHFIGRFNTVEHVMGCEWLFSFELCEDCEQEVTEIESEADIKAFNREFWSFPFSLSGKFCFVDPDETVLEWGGGCCPISEERLREALELEKGQIYRVEFDELSVISSRDFMSLSIIGMQKLNRAAAKSIFLYDESEFEDW